MTLSKSIVQVMTIDIWEWCSEVCVGCGVEREAVCINNIPIMHSKYEIL